MDVITGLNLKFGMVHLRMLICLPRTAKDLKCFEDSNFHQFFLLSEHLEQTNATLNHCLRKKLFGTGLLSFGYSLLVLNSLI